MFLTDFLCICPISYSEKGLEFSDDCGFVYFSPQFFQFLLRLF